MTLFLRKNKVCSRAANMSFLLSWDSCPVRTPFPCTFHFVILAWFQPDMQMQAMIYSLEPLCGNTCIYMALYRFMALSSTDLSGLSGSVIVGGLL
jgi:hypothetical protein